MPLQQELRQASCGERRIRLHQTVSCCSPLRAHWLSRTILPCGTKAVPSATYTTLLGPTATPPVKERAPPVRNVWVLGLLNGIWTTSPWGSPPLITSGLGNSCEAWKLLSDPKVQPLIGHNSEAHTVIGVFHGSARLASAGLS